jgi:hypothetical protein
MQDNLLINFEAEKMYTEEIECTDLPKYNKYVWKENYDRANGKIEYLIRGIDFNEELTLKSRNFTNMCALKDVLIFGEYIYRNYERDSKNNPKFLKNDKESLTISEKLIDMICKKYGIPITKQDYFEIYDFAFFCYDLYTRFCAWMYITEGEDIATARKYLGNLSYLKTKRDIKAHIVPVEIWDYNREPVTVYFYYDKETDEYKRIYRCSSLKELALLQFNLLFFSKAGIISEDDKKIKIKTCPVCHKDFATTTTQQKYCKNCKKKSLAENKRRSRERLKKK